ncbi:hypothetical protein FB547_1315 [Variovorax beijingensis]|uniref:Uncharacterized protein n=1 Tax=Variovorax beijingensis TaxID=2496117 RepID=A0A561B0I8_9BURK|nr:hypothetical protein FB547_1315 [Variovorax beijingensis]
MPNAAIETVVDTNDRPFVRSDRGAHCRWPGWQSRIGDAKLVRSMARKGCSPDNSACEGFFGRRAPRSTPLALSAMSNTGKVSDLRYNAVQLFIRIPSGQRLSVLGLESVGVRARISTEGLRRLTWNTSSQSRTCMTPSAGRVNSRIPAEIRGTAISFMVEGRVEATTEVVLECLVLADCSRTDCGRKGPFAASLPLQSGYRKSRGWRLGLTPGHLPGRGRLGVRSSRGGSVRASRVFP